MIPNIYSSDFPTINLECGRKIYAKRIHITETYGGWLEGFPDDGWNQQMLDGMPRRMQSIFGDLPVHIIPPEVKHFSYPGRSAAYKVALMPPVEIAMHFVSHDALTPYMDGSHVIVVWHQQTLSPLIAEPARIQLERLNWANIAKDFIF